LSFLAISFCLFWNVAFSRVAISPPR
jgi:hypothetical protein